MTDLTLLVAGGRGQLGTDLAGRARGVVWAPGSAELDVTDPAAVTEVVSKLVDAAHRRGRPAVVINAAAYTAVDAAESEQDRAHAVNVDGARLLAETCAQQDIPLVQVSTDYVFSEPRERPYEPDDPARPCCVYGRTKLAGERAVLATGNAWVVRTSWVYGATGRNFVKTVLRLEREHANLSIVDDQHGSPTWSADLAVGLLELAARLAVGRAPEQRILHCTGAGETTWYKLARGVFEEHGADPDRVKPCRTEDFHGPAPRPAYTVLSNAAWRAAGMAPLRHWRAALAAAFAEIGPQLRGG